MALPRARTGLRRTRPHGGYSFVVVLVVAVVLFAATLAVPWWRSFLPDRQPGPVAVAALMTVLGGAGLLLFRTGPDRLPGHGRHHGPVGALSRATGLLLQLTPVAVLPVVYPAVSGELLHNQVGGVAMQWVILAASLATPWISQGTCMPLYAALNDLPLDRDTATVRRRLWQTWPAALILSLPVTSALGLVVRWAVGWSWAATGCFTALVTLNMIFAQALVVTGVGRTRFAWAAAWCAFAACVWFLPTIWWLPPVAGMVPPLLLLLRYVLIRPVWPPTGVTLRRIGQGLLTGAAMWADKLLILLVVGTSFSADLFFMAFAPATIAYNFYFACLAPGFDHVVDRLRSAIETRSLGELGPYSRSLTRWVAASLLLTATVCGGLSLLVTWLVSTYRPGYAGSAAAVALYAAVFMLLTITCYTISYAGYDRAPWITGLWVLCTMTGLFGLVPLGPELFLSMAVLGLLTLVGISWFWSRAWRTPEYTLFWRHATAW